MSSKEEILAFTELFKGADDWHIHSNYTDGKNTVAEMCCSAEQKGLRFVCFLEHVRRDLTYNYSQFQNDVESEGKNSPVVFRAGAEAKLLPDGSIDISETIAKQAWCVFVAYHGGEFPTAASFITAMQRALRNPVICGWAHPLHFSNSTNWALSSAEIRLLAETAASERVVLEYNYKRPGNSDLLKYFIECGGIVVPGSNAHTANDILTPQRDLPF
jgi:putative hydrolase